MVALINQTSAPRLERSCVPLPEDWIAVAPSRPGLERIEARFSGHAFDPHRHDTYAIGYTMSG
ncbi:MAG: AraC family ligand binding domain-containing protein, partial [Hyphomicrobiales bacterium]